MIFLQENISESTYSANKSWDKQAHLGSQDELTPGQKILAGRPTRIVSAILDMSHTIVVKILL